jgi:hypothetical protein
MTLLGDCAGGRAFVGAGNANGWATLIARMKSVDRFAHR